MEDITAIARQLELDSQSARIKKLLLYATAGYWESNPDNLNSIGIVPMLAQLCQLYPTLQQLRFYLHTIAANLTKPIEYQQLADVILLQCASLYPEIDGDEDEPTAFFSSHSVPQKPSIDTALCKQQQEISQRLELRLERERIVKLLICLTRDHWESDAQKIAQTSIRELLDEIWRTFPNLDEVERSLFSIVQRLSKAVEYSVVATAMVREITPLYQQSSQSDTQIPATALPLVQSIDGFDLRLELMKFTNPLRVKILLFSLLHQPFDQSEQAWSALKRYSLDMLLKALLERYPPTEVGAKLQAVAAQLPMQEEYEQTIDVLLRSLKLPLPSPPQPAQIGDAEDDESTEIRLSPVIVKS
jgi:hypothetical protein